jgi:hypothetical protein
MEIGEQRSSGGAAEEQQTPLRHPTREGGGVWAGCACRVPPVGCHQLS